MSDQFNDEVYQIQFDAMVFVGIEPDELSPGERVDLFNLAMHQIEYDQWYNDSFFIDVSDERLDYALYS